MRTFALLLALHEVIDQIKLEQPEIILLNKLNIPKEILIEGQVEVFKSVFNQILFRSLCNYRKATCNKIILLTSKFENDNMLSINLTDGGNLKISTILKENDKAINWIHVNQKLLVEFSGHLELICGSNNGKTIRCFLPLNQ